MAYATGSGATGMDFLDAVRSFAVGLGWTAAKWDTTNNLLYISKGLCRVAIQYFTASITVWNGTTSSAVTEGHLRGTLCQAFGTGIDWYNFAGAAVAASTRGRDSGPTFLASKMQGPFVQWFLFSNATGDYIHCIMQDGSDTYNYFGFGNGDKGGLTHSGVAYVFADGGRYWYQESTSAAWTPGEQKQRIYFNKPSSNGGNFLTPDARRFSTTTFQLYTENALPAGFVNNQAVAAVSNSYSRTAQRCLPLRTRFNFSVNLPSQYPNYDSGSGGNLLDNIITMEQPGYTSFVPMLGMPLVFTNLALTQYCAVGSMPDIRMINLTGLSPQQELSLGSDVWKVFPLMRQSGWQQSLMELAPSSGQYGIALKKIV